MTELARPTVPITVVELPSCHLCDEAIATIGELSKDHPLTVTIVDASSEEGLALIAEHRPGLAPLVLLDGEFFSAGRLPRRRLERTLSARGSRVRVSH